MDTQHSITSIFQKYFSKSSRYSKVSISVRFSPKVLSKAERCFRKREVKLSIVFETVRFWIMLCVFSKNGVKLSVFGKNAELQYSLSAKTQSKTV
jgi:hypothetical protein